MVTPLHNHCRVPLDFQASLDSKALLVQQVKMEPQVLLARLDPKETSDLRYLIMAT